MPFACFIKRIFSVILFGNFKQTPIFEGDKIAIGFYGILDVILVCLMTFCECRIGLVVN